MATVWALLAAEAAVGVVGSVLAAKWAGLKLRPRTVQPKGSAR